MLVPGDAVAGVIHLRDEHLHGGVATARLFERVLEPALHAVVHHLRQRSPPFLGRRAVDAIPKAAASSEGRREVVGGDVWA